MRVCPDCNKVVSAVDSVLIRGKYYHKRCRVCYKCGEVIKLGKHEFDGHVYHTDCFLSKMRCCVCGRMVLNPHTDWYGNVACDEHAHLCHYCRRFITPDIGGEHPFQSGYFEDGVKKVYDGYICGECKSAIIQTENDVERCRHEVLELFRNNGIDGIPIDIPIKLTDMHDEEQSLGITPWGLNYSYLSKTRTTYSCEISIRDNLPELQFKGTLGHELLHSWLFLYAIKLPKNEIEGFCNLGSLLVYKNNKSQASDFLINYMLDKNEDPIYGEGYRLMKMRLDKLGWKGLMDALLLESNKP